MNRPDLTTGRQAPRLFNGPAKPITPVDDEPPEAWDEEVLGDLPEEEQEPVPPT